MPVFGFRRASISLARPDDSTGNNFNSKSTIAAMFRSGRPYKSWYRSRTKSILVVLWAIFTVFLGIMIVVVFVQPQWIGGKHPVSGTVIDFGLYRNCTENWGRCSGTLTNFDLVPSAAWKAATIFVIFGFLAVFISLLVLIFFVLCCLNKSGLAFRYISGLQTFAGFCLFVTCVIYPAGWGAPAVRTVCGPNAGSFSAGACQIKWAYWVAVVCMVDSFILSFLSLMFIEREGLTDLQAAKKRSPSFTLNGFHNNNVNQSSRSNSGLDISQENTKL